MKSFLKIFKAQATEILINLKVVRLELAKMQHDVERLLIMEQNMSQNKKPLESIVSTIRDSFGVALWIKTSDHRFIFANKIYCETILRCHEDELEYLTDEDFEKDALSKLCIASDNMVMQAKKTMRFIEYALYENDDKLIVDVVKSPRFENGEVIGTIGSGVIITNKIPERIKKQQRTSFSIEIPLDSSMGHRSFVELLERRRDGKRMKTEDEKHRRRRESLGSNKGIQ